MVTVLRVNPSLKVMCMYYGEKVWNKYVEAEVVLEPP